MAGRKRAARARLDPVRLDVFHHLFAAAAEEMGVTLQRSSFSPNIRERRDFSCALFDGAGRMIGQASHLPVHLGSTPMSVAAAIERIDMGPGDAVVLNDPYAGGTHLPDITFVAPVFLEGAKEPSFFCANRAHHADVGGAAPGSMAPMPDVHGEGLRIPPLRLIRGGELDREILDLLLANMRVPKEREADLLAQWSTTRVGAKRLQEMAREHGAAELARRATELCSWTERLTRDLLSSMPDRRVRFADELEAEAGQRIRIGLELVKKGEELVCDFSSTDAVPASPLNTVRAVTVSAVFYVLRTLLPAFTPTNDGVLRPVRIVTRPGTLVDARYPSGVAAGNVETSQRIVDVLLGALGKLLPGRIPAASAGTMSNFTFGGEANGERFTYYETIAGGAGAGAANVERGTGAASAVQTHMTNTRNTPIEELETSYPVRVLGQEIERGSGGEGRARGGDGMRKHLRFLAPVQVAWVADRQTRGPWGLAGGAAGEPGGARVRMGSVAPWRQLGPRAALSLPAGSEIELRTPGGGGYGIRRRKA